MLKNKTIAISGSTGRIGSAFVRAVVQNNANVVMGDIDEKAGNSLVKELGKDRTLFVPADLVNPSEIDNFLKAGIKKFNTIDACVHCAYPRSEQWGKRFEDLQPEFLAADLHKQLGGTILFSQRVLKKFSQQGFGNLIHISSIQGVAAPKFDHYEGTQMVSPIEYSAIKAGVIAVSRYLAKYYKKKNIRVNCISPGGILDNQPDIFLDRYRNSCSSKGMLDAQDLCGTLLFLLSDHSNFITGQNIIVDDGWTL